jgi:hypothetical protein
MSSYTKDPPISRFPIPLSHSPLGRLPPLSRPEPWNQPNLEPLDWLLAVMRSEEQPTLVRMEAAKIAAPYRHCSYRPVRTEEQLRLAQEKLRQKAKPK